MSKPNGKSPPRRDTFLRLSHELLASPEWKELNVTARALYVAIAARFNGYNNGDILFSRREASKQLRIGATKAVQAFADVQAAGLIEPKRKGWMSPKFRQATRWTVHPLPVRLGTSRRSAWGPVITGLEVGPVTGPKAGSATGPPGDQYKES